MRSHPGVSADFFGALADAGINIRMISTSEIRISAVVDAADLDVAVIATHRAFGLEDGQSTAVVYGGAGRGPGAPPPAPAPPSRAGPGGAGPARGGGSLTPAPPRGGAGGC